MADEIERAVELFGGNQFALKVKLKDIFEKFGLSTIEALVIEESVDEALAKHNLKK